MSASPSAQFHVGISADFLNEHGELVFPDIGLSLLSGMEGLSYEFLLPYRPEYDREQLAGCDVVISLKPRVTARSLEGVEQLCAIGRCGVGYDNVDLPACTARDVAVYITPTAVVRPVAESIVLLVLALSHHLVLKDMLVREGKWVESTRRLGREPRGRVAGSVGLGNIGSETMRLLAPFGFARLLAFDPWTTPEKAARLGVELVSFDELLQKSDYLLVNCPLTDATRGLIGSRELSLMKPDAVLINTARGPIVNEQALIEALQSGRLSGAALDVFEKEPVASDSPLLQMENVIVTSHSIAWTEELFRDMGRMDCEGALAVMRGEPPQHVVNREVLDRPGFQRKLDRFRTRAGAIA